MSTLFHPKSLHFTMGILFLILVPTYLVGQAACLGMPPPDDSLYMIPDRILETYDFSSHGIRFIHDYGLSWLAYLSDTNGIPSTIISQIHELSHPASISFRNYFEELATPASLNVGGFQDGVWLLSLFGPSDFRLTELLRANGVQILDTAHPYGLLVKAGSASLDAAMGLCTSEGYRLIRAVYSLPKETRMSGLLLKIATGKLTDLKTTNLLLTDDGGIIVRILPYNYSFEENTLALLSTYSSKASTELALGHSDGYVIHPNALFPVLSAVEGIAFIQPIVAPRTASNIAMRGDILDIAPVWTDLGYNGEGVTILHNDTGIYLEHKDFCLNPSTATCGIVYDQQNAVIKAATADLNFNSKNAHGTHTAGLLAGQGHDPFTGDVDNMCLCRPRPEENPGITNNYCGGFHAYLNHVKGAAPGARIVANNNFAGTEYEDTILYMMQWGSKPERGAIISSNSWWLEESDEVGNDPTSYGNYEQQAVDVDTAVRDANPDLPGSPGLPGNQEMLIVFAAGNNDAQTEAPDLNPWTLVECPGVAKNALTVGATENPRCGFARHYILSEDGSDTKTPRAPHEDWIYERSGRGLSQGRVKPDIVAVGADVLSTQSPIDEEHDSFECLDCRPICSECPDCTTVNCDCGDNSCSYKFKAKLGEDFGSCQYGAAALNVQQCRDGNGDIKYWNPHNDTWSGPTYQTISGTSQATPIAAGAAAVFYQFYKDLYGCFPSPAMAKAALINGAEDISSADHKYPFMGRANCRVLSNEDEIGTDTSNPADGIPEYYTDSFTTVPRNCTDQGWGRLNLKRSIVGLYDIGGQIYFVDECTAPSCLDTG